jgi:hypothetical protein
LGIVSDSKDGDSPYGGDFSHRSVAFFGILKADKDAGKSCLRPDYKPSKDKMLEELDSFISWYQRINTQSDFEKAVIESGRISTPGEPNKETLAKLHMEYSLYFEDRGRRELHDFVWAFHRGRSFFKTKEGWMGTVEGLPSENDVVAIIPGLSMPVVLSSVEGSYRMVGTAYVYQMMQGELWPESLDGLQLITIV